MLKVWDGSNNHIFDNIGMCIYAHNLLAFVDLLQQK